MRTKYSPLLVAVASALIGSEVVAGASTAEPFLEEIVVTARKRAESLQDAPLAVSAFSGSILDQMNISSLEDVARLTPNTRFSFAQGSPSDNKITIRGMTSNSGNAQPGIDPSVSFYLDGVYLQRPEQLDMELLGIEGVEILRGPQGTLYGKNSTVGAVLVNTTKPDIEEFSANLMLEAGNYDLLKGSALVNVPLGDTFAMSVAAYKMDRDGYRENAVDGADVGDADRLGGRLKFRMVTERVDAVLGVDYQDDESNSSIGDILVMGYDPLWALLPPELVPEGAAVTTPGDIWDKYVEKTPASEENETKNSGANLTVDVDLGFAQLTSITGYRDFEVKNFIDFDFTAEPFFRTGRDNDQDQFSQEFRLTSDTEGPLSYVAGLYYFESNLVSSLTSNLDDPTLISPDIPAFLGGTQIAHTSDLDVESYAAFTQVSYEFADRWSWTVGLRYDDESRDIEIQQSIGPLFDGISFPVGSYSDSRSEDNITGMTSLMYSLSDQTNLYVTYSEGVKSGGFNGGGISGTDVSLEKLDFDTEQSTNYEAGLKYRSENGRYTLNAAIFQIDFEDLQVQIFDAPELFTDNAAEARSRGVELESRMVPVDNALLAISIGYNDAEYVDYDYGPLMGGQFGDKNGDPLPDAPEWQGSILGSYDIPLVAMNSVLTIAGDYLYTGSHQVGAIKDPTCEQDDYSLFNARVDLRSDNGTWGLQLWGRNLTDEEYMTGCALLGSVYAGGPGFNRLAGTYLGVPGLPRTYGLRLNYNF